MSFSAKETNMRPPLLPSVILALFWVHRATATKRPNVATSGTTMGPDFSKVTSKLTVKCPSQGRALADGKVRKQRQNLLNKISLEPYSSSFDA